MGNEPGFGVPWVYNYVGQPWKTQQLVDRVRSQLFAPTPDGEPGNDDLGALSSWYVWAGLGLYPATPGTSILTVNTPLFDAIEIALPAGKSIRLTAPGASGANRLRYIDKMRVNGQVSEQTSLPESIVDTGGELAFSLSDKPNKDWGTAESSAPPSFGAGSLAVAVNVSPSVVKIAPGATGTVTVDAQRMIDGPADYSISATSYGQGITATPVSGRFADDGSAHASVTIKVPQAVRDGYHPVVLTTKVGERARTFMLLVAVGKVADNGWLTS
jgi:hypothetical protein